MLWKFVSFNIRWLDIVLVNEYCCCKNIIKNIANSLSAIKEIRERKKNKINKQSLNGVNVRLN